MSLLQRPITNLTAEHHKLSMLECREFEVLAHDAGSHQCTGGSQRHAPLVNVGNMDAAAHSRKEQPGGTPQGTAKKRCAGGKYIFVYSTARSTIFS